MSENKIKTIKLSLVEAMIQRGLVKDAKEATSLIMAGKVLLNNQRVDQSSAFVKSEDMIKVRETPQFVSRGGEKLLGLILDANIAEYFMNARILDIGSSTGGFTDCALQHGAKSITCVDVGSNQLDWSIRSNPLVSTFEKTHIKDFIAPENIIYDIIMADISFNSLSRLWPYISNQPITPLGIYILLIKPQFELSSKDVEINGIVQDVSLHQKAIVQVKTAVKKSTNKNLNVFPSRVLGRTGNHEYFLLIKS